MITRFNLSKRRIFLRQVWLTYSRRRFSSGSAHFHRFEHENEGKREKREWWMGISLCRNRRLCSSEWDFNHGKHYIGSRNDRCWWNNVENRLVHPSLTSAMRTMEAAKIVLFMFQRSFKETNCSFVDTFRRTWSRFARWKQRLQRIHWCWRSSSNSKIEC